MLMELSRKQGVNISSFVSTMINNLYQEMKRTGRKPLWIQRFQEKWIWYVRFLEETNTDHIYCNYWKKSGWECLLWTGLAVWNGYSEETRWDELCNCCKNLAITAAAQSFRLLVAFLLLIILFHETNGATLFVASLTVCMRKCPTLTLPAAELERKRSLATACPIAMRKLTLTQRTCKQM